MDARIGFYICHCGINIAYKVDVQEVAAFIQTLPGVVVSRDYQFMCSDPGQDMIIKDIQEHSLNRVVVASCSPRMHEKTFQNACYRAGLNPYLFQMTCVREHCSWVIEDPEEATHKAKHLAAAAVNRVQLHQKLYPRQESVHPDVLVVGGGIAGMQAALDVARSGHQVYLVEKTPSIGGHMLQFDKTFPTLDCAACIGTPKMVDVGQNPNINLLTYSEVKDVSGFIGNYQVTIHKKPRYVIEGVCTGCGECAKVCPVTMPSEWNEGLSNRAAIYRTFPQAIPITFCIDKRDRAPCTRACPAGVNVQGYVQLISQGKYQEALELIYDRLPLPGVLGRVCPHPCEDNCRRSQVDSAVAIRSLKRFAADSAKAGPEPLQKPEREEKVAIIGSGPAGLAAACFLRQQGFQVCIFEASQHLGGMLRTGIPDFRLPQEILDQEIQLIMDLGIEARTGVCFGEDITLQDLKNQGFAAAFIAIGAQAGARLGLEEEKECPGVMDAVSFLQKVNLGEEVQIGPRVLIIGGGNVALDAARVALRTGGKEVRILYRRSAQEMPAHLEEIQEARREGVRISFLTSPCRLVLEQSCLKGLECKQNQLGEPDSSGRRRPEPVEGSEHVLEADTILAAVGQRVQADWAQQEPDLAWTRRGTLQSDPKTMQTSLDWVFAAGDAVTGPATVVQAIGGARQAAEAICRYLDGEELKSQSEEQAEQKPGEDWRPVPEELEPEERPASEQLPPEQSLQGFWEVEKPLQEESAVKEAQRCLNCGVCSECMECVRACGPNAIDHSMQPEDLQVNVGSIILATGYDLMDPGVIHQFGYGHFPNVLTSLEFERLNNATGPTSGEIRLRDFQGDFQGKPESVGIVHCVGSRDSNHHEYCSRVCCMYALKYAHLIKDKLGHDVPVYNFYIDLRCFGKGYEEFYRRVQEEGVTLVRGRPAEITDQALSPAEEGKLTVVCEDTLLGRNLRIPVDMVILCPAMEPSQDSQELTRLFGLSQGKDGFFLEEHPKLGPNTTATDGIFLGGCCQGPKDIPDSVSHASGAAAQALSLATRGEVSISPTISWIDPDICIGCQVCIGLCAYGAISFDARRGVSVVNEAMCKGCGSCAGYCPSGAAQVRHFSQKQIFSELEGILEPVYGTDKSAQAHAQEAS
ncbi:MAG: FAD-dependent oxidoreductase [Thermodesulfobacteriota bacterium]